MTSAQTHRYEIRIRGHLDENHSPRLGNFSLRYEIKSGKPYTVLNGVLPDQAALFGLLNKMSALGLSLVDLHEQEP